MDIIRWSVRGSLKYPLVSAFNPFTSTYLAGVLKPLPRPVMDLNPATSCSEATVLTTMLPSALWHSSEFIPLLPSLPGHYTASTIFGTSCGLLSSGLFCRTVQAPFLCVTSKLLYLHSWRHLLNHLVESVFCLTGRWKRVFQTFLCCWGGQFIFYF